MKTYQQDFYEKFPNAEQELGGTPRACRQRIYGQKDTCEDEDTHEVITCIACWNRPMPEADK